MADNIINSKNSQRNRQSNDFSGYFLHLKSHSCEGKHIHRAEFPSLRLRRTEPLPQHAEPPVTAREHPNYTENFTTVLSHVNIRGIL